jgi:uncharacterized membrane protein
MDQNGWGSGSWLWACVLMLIALALVIGLAVWLGSHRREQHDNGSARQILDERLARGDITEADYRRDRALLGPAASNTPPAPSGTTQERQP